MSGFNYNKWDNIVDSDDEESAPKKVPVQPASSAPAPAATNSGGDDNRSEVEKLKAKKRAERAEREAREAANPSDTAAAKAESLLMEEVAEALPSVDTNAADAVQSSSNAEKELTQAEATVASMKAEIATLKLELPLKTPENEAKLKKRTLALQGQVGKLQNTIDDIFLGEIEDETVRAAAKSRRKAINALCEEWFPEEIGALKKLAC